jgi:hypothetical protein
VSKVDGVLVLAVDRERETAERVTRIAVPPLERPFGVEAQNDAVGALEHDVLGHARRRFRPDELTVEGGHPPDISADERYRADPVRQPHGVAV